MMHMNTPPVKNVRVTVPVTPDVLVLFQRLSDVSGKSVGRLMGEWLDETREGLEPMIEIVKNFKVAPKLAVRALQLRAEVVSDMASEALRSAMDLGLDAGTDSGRKRSVTLSAAASVFPRDGVLSPPSSNTGGKGRKTSKKPVGDSK